MRTKERWIIGIVSTTVLMCLVHLNLTAQAPRIDLRTLGTLQEGEDLRTRLGDFELVGEWIYDDLDEGLRQAKESDKPLMVVFRCVT